VSLIDAIRENPNVVTMGLVLPLTLAAKLKGQKL
jgi:hypothetical protein